MSIPAILEKYRTEIESELKAVIDARPMPLYGMMRYHLGWIDKDGQPVNNNTGKALRPSLCLFTCEAVGGRYSAALPAAAALELVHNFSLIHDDIQDNDRERRHRPTVWAIWGRAQAINAGTAMRILANVTLQRLNGLSLEKQGCIHHLIDEISLRLIEGQYLDISFEDRFDITVADYLNMVDGKTAALISGAMEIGALIGSEDKTVISRLAGIGRQLGLAFQIRDDILGIWGDQKQTGKPAGADIRRRKKSYPFVYALEHTDGSTRKELVSIYKKRLIDDANVNKALEIFHQVETQQQAAQIVDEYCTRACLDFKKLNIPQASKDQMDELVQFLVGRTY
jgi:geranylgeranyl diphosphate synthase type I